LLYFANVQAFRDLVAAGRDVALEWRSMKEFLMPGAAPALRHHLELVEKLLSLKLVDHEWAQYKEHRDWTPRPSPPPSSRGRGSKGEGNFNRAVSAAERYYTAAEARNGAMADQLFTALGANCIG